MSTQLRCDVRSTGADAAAVEDCLRALFAHKSRGVALFERLALSLRVVSAADEKVDREEEEDDDDDGDDDGACAVCPPVVRCRTLRAPSALTARGKCC
jgi:hypothetical protein